MPSQWLKRLPCPHGFYESLGHRRVEPSNGSNVTPRRARFGLAGLGPHVFPWRSPPGGPGRKTCATPSPGETCQRAIVSTGVTAE